MYLVVRKPGFRSVRSNSTEQIFDNFFNRNLGDFFGNDFLKDTPSVNIIENEQDFKIELAAPGLDKADFNIKIENKHLLVSTKKETNKEEAKEGKFVRREFSYASFQRSFRLPELVNGSDIKASYENGVLTVTLPKTEKVDNSRLIEIQ